MSLETQVSRVLNTGDAQVSLGICGSRDLFIYIRYSDLHNNRGSLGTQVSRGYLGTEYSRFPHLVPRSPSRIVGHMVGSLIFISLIDKTRGGPFHRHVDGEDWALNTGDALVQFQGLPEYSWVT